MKTKYFKGFSLTCVLAVILQLLCGCSGGHRGEELFFYKNKPLTASVSLECNGESSSFEYKRENNAESLVFTAPSQLEGFSLSSSEGDTVISIDGLSAEAPEALTLPLKIASELFSLSSDGMTGVESVENPSGTRIFFQGFSVTVDQSGIPVFSEGVLFGVSYRAEITELVCG